MKLTELSAGDLVITDEGFTCMKPGSHTVHADEAGRLFIPCAEGKHYLQWQVSFNDPDMLIGISKPVPQPHEN